MKKIYEEDFYQKLRFLGLTHDQCDEVTDIIDKILTETKEFGGLVKRIKDGTKSVIVKKDGTTILQTNISKHDLDFIMNIYES